MPAVVENKLQLSEVEAGGPEVVKAAAPEVVEAHDKPTTTAAEVSQGGVTAATVTAIGEAVAGDVKADGSLVSSSDVSAIGVKSDEKEDAEAMAAAEKKYRSIFGGGAGGLPVDDGLPEEEMSSEDARKIQQLEAYDDEYVKLEQEFKKASQKLKLEYEAKQMPFIQKRKEYLASETGTIPKFWARAICNMPTLDTEIQKWDIPVLDYLVNVEHETIYGKSPANTSPEEEDEKKEEEEELGFRLVFEWAKDNPYFTNERLSLVFNTFIDNIYTGDTAVASIILEEPIHWKAGMDVTVESADAPKKKGKKGGKKSAPRKVPRPSLFRMFFRTLDAAHIDDIDDLFELSSEFFDEDDEAEDMLEMLQNNSLSTGSVIAETIIPFAVRWFTGEAIPEMEDEEFEEDEDDASVGSGDDAHDDDDGEDTD